MRSELVKRWVQTLSTSALVALERKLGIYAPRDAVDHWREYGAENRRRIIVLEQSIESLKASMVPVVLFRAIAKWPGGMRLDEEKGETELAFQLCWAVRASENAVNSGVLGSTIWFQPDIGGRLLSIELLNSAMEICDVTISNVHIMPSHKAVWPAGKEFPIPAALAEFSPANRISVRLQMPAKDQLRQEFPEQL